MILRSLPASPFGRKCKMSALVLGLMDRIDIVAADPRDPQDSLRQQNPLGKIPTLITDDGLELFDSPVICEYLDWLAGGGNLFPDGEARWSALRLQALGDGILDAAVLQVYEGRYRPEEMWYTPWLGYLDFRFDGTWREGHPNLVTWLYDFQTQVPAFGETTPHD